MHAIGQMYWWRQLAAGRSLNAFRRGDEGTILLKFWFVEIPKISLEMWAKSQKNWLQTFWHLQIRLSEIRQNLSFFSQTFFAPYVFFGLQSSFDLLFVSFLKRFSHKKFSGKFGEFGHKSFAPKKFACSHNCVFNLTHSVHRNCRNGCVRVPYLFDCCPLLIVSRLWL